MACFLEYVTMTFQMIYLKDRRHDSVDEHLLLSGALFVSQTQRVVESFLLDRDKKSDHKRINYEATLYIRIVLTREL
ncbi:unnamed protein product [Candida parapsilosis]